MASDKLTDVPASDYPLTVTVTTAEDDREVHRVNVSDPASLSALGINSPDLDERFPGKKTLVVTDVHGKTRLKETLGE